MINLTIIDDQGMKKCVVATSHRIEVKFIAGTFTDFCEDAGPAMRARLNVPADVKLCVSTFHVAQPGQLEIRGFGIPYFNRSNLELERIVRNESKVGRTGLKLVQALANETVFHFVVAMQKSSLDVEVNLDRLPEPFVYPLGTNHTWDEERIRKDLSENKFPQQFDPVFSYDNDNAHRTVMNQCVIQDVFWLHEAAESMRTMLWSVYFVAIPESTKFFVIVPLTQEFRDRFDAAWQRLTRGEAFKFIHYAEPNGDGKSEKWDCKIVDHPERDAILSDHPIESFEIVLIARIGHVEVNRVGELAKPLPTKIFASRSDALKALENGKQHLSCIALDFDAKISEAERRVDAINSFAANYDLPSNPKAHGIAQDMPEVKRAETMLMLQSRMLAHRQLLLGKGFFEWMTANPPDLRGLPVLNILGFGNDAYADAIIKCVLPEDRPRFRRYLENRTLGLGLVSAAAGFGKTSLLAVATMALQAFQSKVHCSGSSNVAIDNFARRLDATSKQVCNHYNQFRPPDKQERFRLVVRGYSWRDELGAFCSLLKDADRGDKAAPGRGWTGGASKWRFELSLAYWLLVVLGCRAPGVAQLGPQHAQCLHDLRARLIKDSRAKQTLDFFAGRITKQELTQPIEKVLIESMMRDIVAGADLLCTTPSLSDSVDTYKKFKKEKAKATAIDEAANITRADLYLVWGNTLSPIFLGGDVRQLPPMCLTGGEQDKDGNFIHAFAHDAKISPLEFFQAGGWPVFRLCKQLRMGVGLFDLVATHIYSEISVTYGDSCRIDLPAFEDGRKLESFVQSRYPGVSPVPQGKLQPFFLHCKGSYVHVDRTSGSRLSRDQIKVALEFAVNFTTTMSVNPANVTVLSPYSANVQYIEEQRKRGKYPALANMPLAATVDGYQGQENNIIIVVMGTNQVVGPGFTVDAQRLNVMLTRQRCGLVIVGDINVVPPEQKGKGKLIVSRGPDGVVTFHRGTTLREIFRDLKPRCATVEILKAI